MLNKAENRASRYVFGSFSVSMNLTDPQLMMIPRAGLGLEDILFLFKVLVFHARLVCPDALNSPDSLLRCEEPR